MSYTYTDGDGLTALDKTTPNGATEPVSNLDDAIRQIKAYMRDSTGGLAKLKADVDELAATISGKMIATKSGAQLVTAGAGASIVQFNTEAVDAAAAFDPTTYKYTAPESGLYFVVASLRVSLSSHTGSPTDINHKLQIFIAGIAAATQTIVSQSHNDEVTIQISRMFNLSAGQTIDVRYVVTVGSGTYVAATSTDATDTIFQVVKAAA